MPKVQFMVLSERPNTYTGKRGFVQERVLALVDTEVEPTAVLGAVIELVLRKGDPDDQKFPEGKLGRKVIEVGMQNIDKFNGTLRIKGPILRVIEPGK